MRLVVTARLNRGSHKKVQEILREGPPYELAHTMLASHQVFLGQDDLVFVFDGLHAGDEVRKLLDDLAVVARVGRLARHFERTPRVLDEVFAWERETLPEGVDFSAYPGPGDSDGG